jgi:hypothetical protein
LFAEPVNEASGNDEPRYQQRRAAGSRGIRDYDAIRLRQSGAEHGGALVDGWKLFGAASLFNETAE